MRAWFRLRCCAAGEDQQRTAVRITQHGCNSRVACRSMLGGCRSTIRYLWVAMKNAEAAVRCSRVRLDYVCVVVQMRLAGWAICCEKGRRCSHSAPVKRTEAALSNLLYSCFFREEKHVCRELMALELMG